jgi:hypothetical protein
MSGRIMDFYFTGYRVTRPVETAKEYNGSTTKKRFVRCRYDEAIHSCYRYSFCEYLSDPS